MLVKLWASYSGLIYFVQSPGGWWRGAANIDMWGRGYARCLRGLTSSSIYCLDRQDSGLRLRCKPSKTGVPKSMKASQPGDVVDTRGAGGTPYTRAGHRRVEKRHSGYAFGVAGVGAPVWDFEVIRVTHSTTIQQPFSNPFNNPFNNPETLCFPIQQPFLDF